MRKVAVSTILVCVMANIASATVFLNEILINPSGGADAGYEYIELMGTPGKNLDGYAVAFLSGGEGKYHSLGSIPPYPPTPEIDEFFSLDGLQLGPNGILVIGIGLADYYVNLLPDAHFQRWDTIWNGGLDTPGKLQNDGSNTILLIRNRPGQTQADPTHPDGLRWGKDISFDAELISPVNVDGTDMDQFGNGAIDKGEPDNMGGFTLDMRGFQTSDDITDDLEIVDEVSYEHEQGWEYDLDTRTVDLGDSSIGGLPERKVHSLDDPQGFNPDCLTRVDYRTSGDGWTPAPGATGAMTNGNNWQDTATEQWIRGESVLRIIDGSYVRLYYSNAANTNLDAIQPYETNVPLWLNDGIGDDFDFATADAYEMMAGRINPLATTFIAGDADRDGDADQDDIDKIAAVFGNDDWIFSNSFATAPEGKSGDPATQTRPWDVDATGDNGIEASDLQWTLNFLGDTTGRIVGVQYDGTGPAATGVTLNPNTGLACTVSTSTSAVQVFYGLQTTLTVSAEVNAGANTSAGQENGIMQFVHDLAIDTAGVAKIISVTPVNGFATTRSDIQISQGTDGDTGMTMVNGYTTSFQKGLSSAADMYEITIEGITPGSAYLTVSPAADAKFAASTPHGLKVGHTDSNGNPATATYPAAVSISVLIPGDFNGDNTVEWADFGTFASQWQATGCADPTWCSGADLNQDGSVEWADFGIFASHWQESI